MGSDKHVFAFVLLTLHHCLLLSVSSSNTLSLCQQVREKNKAHCPLSGPDINAHSDPGAPLEPSTLHPPCLLRLLPAHVISSLFSQGKYKLSPPYLHLYYQIFSLMESMQICPFLEPQPQCVDLSDGLRVVEK